MMSSSMDGFSGQIAPSGKIPQSDVGGGGGNQLEDTTLDEPVMDTIKRDMQMVWHKIKKVAIPSNDTKDELRNWDLWGPLFLCLTLAILLSIDESDASNNSHDRPAAVFSSLLVMVAVGAIVVTVNAKLLGGNVSFFQNICLLGYCVAPLILATVLCITVRIVMSDVSFTCGLGEFNKGGSKVTTTCGPPAWPEGVCKNSANETANVGVSCGGWADDKSCTGDARCNSPRTVVGNVLLRLVFALGGMVWSLRSSLGFLSEVVKPERRGLAAYPVCLFFASIAWMVMLRTSSA